MSRVAVYCCPELNEWANTRPLASMRLDLPGKLRFSTKSAGDYSVYLKVPIVSKGVAIPMGRNTTIYAGYYISREGLNKWSEREEKVNGGWKKCLTRKKGLVDLAVDSYLWRKKIGHLVKQQFPPKPEHGGCGLHCWNSNFIFYRRCGVTKSLANCKPKDWERFKETPVDREVKEKLQDILHIELSEWTTIVWAPQGMLYGATDEMIKQGGTELIERLENGPPGPCGGDPPLED